MKNNLGIPNFTKYYVFTHEWQNCGEETSNILDFIDLYLKKFKGQ